MASSVAPAATAEEVLEKGLHLAGASPVHLVVRGTAVADSARCDWRGIARTVEQREDAIRFWLGLDADDEIPDESYLEDLFTATISVLDPEYQETAYSNFLAIVRGGLSTKYMFLTCYIDYMVSEYLLGSGPAKLTIAYDRRGEAPSYELYRAEYEAGTFGDEPLQTRGAYQDSLQNTVVSAEASLRMEVGGRELVVFLAPMGAHNAIAVEAWQAVAQWDLQTAEDGTVNAVRYGTSAGDPEHTQTLAKLKSRITTATTGATSTPAPTPTRIANVSGLTQYYRDIGAYGDITPGDDATTTFTPAQPPPAYAGAGGTAVTNPGSNRALVHDCEVLLAVKDALVGTAALNWSVDVAITEWDGVKVSGTPRRVTELKLANRNLTGVIPPELGRLTYLDALWLNGNRLSGEIPRELGGLVNLNTLLLYTNQLSGAIPSQLGTLTNLRILRLSGNSLTGCIPAVLKNLGASNDLGRLGLAYCDARCSFPSSSGGGCSG